MQDMSQIKQKLWLVTKAARCPKWVPEGSKNVPTCLSKEATSREGLQEKSYWRTPITSCTLLPKSKYAARKIPLGVPSGFPRECVALNKTS